MSSIVMTIGVWQLIIDLLSNHLVYRKDPYQRSIRTMERFKGKLDKAEADLKKAEKHRKKFDRAKGDYQGACADVARRHFVPNLLSSLFFIILLRILGTEHSGKVSTAVYFILDIPSHSRRSGNETDCVFCCACCRCCGVCVMIAFVSVYFCFGVIRFQSIWFHSPFLTHLAFLI